MSDVFTITPASTRPLWAIALIAAILLALLLLFVYITYSSQATRFELSEHGLAIRRTMYGRTIAWTSFDLDQARVVDLAQTRELQPTLRTNGVGLPGYQTGWFRLREQGRGLLFVTDRSQVVALPTTEGFTLLLSVRDPSAFLQALRQRAEDRSG